MAGICLMLAVASGSYKSKTSPQEVVVFGLKIQANERCACSYHGCRIDLFYRFYPTEHFEKVPSLKIWVHHRNDVTVLFVWFMLTHNSQPKKSNAALQYTKVYIKCSINMGARRSAVVMSRPSECIDWLLSYNRNNSLGFILLHCHCTHSGILDSDWLVWYFYVKTATLYDWYNWSSA